MDISAECPRVDCDGRIHVKVRPGSMRAGSAVVRCDACGDRFRLVGGTFIPVR